MLLSNQPTLILAPNKNTDSRTPFITAIIEALEKIDQSRYIYNNVKVIQ